MSRPFVDEVDLTVKGGDGGDGCTAFRSEPYKPHGGPYGGNGGPGGNVILEASSGVSTLDELNYKREISAEDGGDGGPKNKQGATGNDQVIRVPEGTIVYDDETGEKLGELTEDGEQFTVARGGDGGRGNSCFKNSRRQAPRFHEFGASGESRHIRLELKLLADVGLVGMPNAGKSTLLDALTGAHPKIAEYDFTTVTPNLGVLFRDYEKLVLCDIPGLIEDAHKGAGLGFEFLRHVDRTKILLHVVDLSAKNPVQKFDMIIHEIRSYDETLIEKPMIVALNKIDRVDEEMVELFLDEIDDEERTFVPISAQDKTNLETLKEAIWSTYEKLPKTEAGSEEEPVERVVKMEQETPVSVTAGGDRFLVRGTKVQELVGRFDLSNPDALAYVRDRLLDIGLHNKLEQAGCRPGDNVQVGKQVFEYTG